MFSAYSRRNRGRLHWFCVKAMLQSSNGLSVAENKMVGVKPSLSDGNGTAVLLFEAVPSTNRNGGAVPCADLGIRETGRFKRGVETVGVHPFFAPARR